MHRKPFLCAKQSKAKLVLFGTTSHGVSFSQAGAILPERYFSDGYLEVVFFIIAKFFSTSNLHLEWLYSWCLKRAETSGFFSLDASELRNVCVCCRWYR